MGCFNYHLLLTWILNTVGLRVSEFSHIRFPTLLSRWIFTSPVWLDVVLRFLARNQFLLSHAKETSPKNPLINGCFQWDASNFFLKWKMVGNNHSHAFFYTGCFGAPRETIEFPFAKKICHFSHGFKNPFFPRSPKSEHPGGIHLVWKCLPSNGAMFKKNWDQNPRDPITLWEW